MIKLKNHTATKVALLLPSAGDARKALQSTLKHLAPDAELWIVQTPGGKVPSVVSSWMIYLGFMGDQPSEDYLEVAMEEYRSRVRDRLDDLQQSAEDQGIKCYTDILVGDSLKAVWKWVHKHKPELIVVARPEIIDPEREIIAKIADTLEKRYTARLYRV